MSKIKSILNDEQGSMSIVVGGILFFGVLLIILLFNFIKIFATADQATTAAEQASIAASTVVYDEAMKVIQSHSYPCGEEEDCYLIDDYNDEKQILSKSSSLSASEIKKKAIDNVLIKMIPGDSILRQKIYGALITARKNIPAVVNKVISENKAEISSTKITFLNSKNRIEVKTAITYNSIEAGFINAMSERIDQMGMGVQIPFAAYVNWTNKTISIN